jgi:hypothetical protein
LQIRQGEVAFAITPIRCSQQREQSGILTEGHKLTITKSPAVRGKIKREDTDFSDKWIGHRISSCLKKSLIEREFSLVWQR